MKQRSLIGIIANLMIHSNKLGSAAASEVNDDVVMLWKKDADRISKDLRKMALRLQESVPDIDIKLVDEDEHES